MELLTAGTEHCGQLTRAPVVRGSAEMAMGSPAPHQLLL